MWKHKIETISIAIALNYVVGSLVNAQIVPDNSLGEESSVVTPVETELGTIDLINGGASRGASLFHSFQEFNVNLGRGAFFSNPEGISNIFSRVTGTNISNINGLLGVTGSANLFLINPNGIVFGDNAALNIQGSFFASSADGLLFDNNLEFGASNPQAPPLLEVSIPIGLNFRDNPGDIINQSSSLDFNNNPIGLQVSVGQSLTLVGGNIDLTGGNLTTIGGNIELGAVTSAGRVNLNEDNSLNFPDSLTRGNITISESSQIAVISLIEGNAGNINLTGNNIALSELSVLEASSVVAGEGNAGNILFDATGSISLNNSVVASNIGAETIGNVGEILLQGNSISVTEGSQLQAGLFAGGQSNETIGRILLQANESITFDSSAIFANNELETIANTVDVEIVANSISLTNSILTTDNDGVGNAGNLSLNASNGEILLTDTVIFTESTTGQGGSVSVSGKSLTLTENSVLGGFATEGGGAGNVNIETTDFVTLNSGSSISVFSSGTGAGGDVAIDTARLDILDESGINAFVFGDLPAGSITINARESVNLDNDGNILLNTIGNGNAGNLELSTGLLNVTGGSQISSSTTAGGEGGNLTINADLIEITGITADGLTPSRIDASTLGSGAGGDIQVNANSLTIRDGAAISASSVFSSANGGNINIDVTGTVNISGFRPLGFFPSSIDTETGGIGNAGNINLTANNLNLSNGAQIDSSTLGTGNGGNIEIIATDYINISGFIPDTRIGSQIASQSISIDSQPVGDGGNIDIFTSDLLVRDAGQITVSGITDSSGTANAGNLFIDADLIKLDNFGVLNAQTFGEEGNINLTGKDIILRGESNITTNASASSSGGNIAIDTDNLIAFPDENSDISANAQNSFGGRVEIDARGIFGTEFREISTPQSDITATSQLGAEFDGEVSLSTPDFDPTTGLIDLPASVGDASDQISQNPCQQGVGSEFIIAGKGGLPPNVNQSLNSESAQVGLIEPISRRGDEETGRLGEENIAPEALPAQGWIFNDKGEVTLVAHSTSGDRSYRNSQSNVSSCQNQH